MVFNFPFPHGKPYGYTILSVLNVPARSANGLHIEGITSLFLLLISLILLTKSVNKYHGRLIVVSIIIVVASPTFLASTFQKTFASGIYAVSYERELSRCSFEMTDKTKMRAVCELPFENYSRDDVQFSIEFYEEYPFEDAIKMLSLMKENEPYEVKLNGKERKRVVIEANIDVSEMKSYIEQGNTTYVNIIIKSGEKTREL
jgi:hypothetical protein